MAVLQAREGARGEIAWCTCVPPYLIVTVIVSLAGLQRCQLGTCCQSWVTN